MLLSYLKKIIFVLFAAFFAAFAVANRQAITIVLFPLPYSATMPLFLFSMLCFALGAVVIGIIMSARSVKNRRLYNHEKKRTAALNNELEGIKAERESHSSQLVA